MTAEERQQAEQATSDWAKLIGVDYVDTRTISTVDSLAGILNQNEMYDWGVVPLVKHGNEVEMGFTERTDRAKLATIGKPGIKFGFHAISDVGFAHIFNLLGLAEYKPELYDGKFVKFADKLSKVEPKEIFPLIAQLAYELGASDIHIEPGMSDPLVRFRLDGTLHPIAQIARDRYDIMLSDLQTGSGIKWGSDLPQTGRVSVQLVNQAGEKTDVNMRIETVPAFHGEEIVVRLFNFTSQYLHLDHLDFRPDQLKVVMDAIHHPTGMILCTGPTGSGKTSTLYAIINELNSPENKIVTLEDPVEYELPGISQIPVHTDDTDSFTQKFRAVMREDPNVIMIGEIRDLDTAKTSLQAALTGHLVLSTFHASSAAAAISRLVDLLGPSPLLASSLRIVMAQRLARRVCPHCKEAYEPEGSERDFIDKQLNSLPDDLRPKMDKLSLYRGKGCNECHGFGYLGRVGIREQLMVSPKLQELLSSEVHKITTIAIGEIASAEGMVTLLQDGLLKALAGDTTLAEVLRVVGD